MLIASKGQPPRPSIDKGLFISIILLMTVATFKGADGIRSGYDDAIVAMVTHPIAGMLRNYGQYILFPLLGVTFAYEFFIKNTLRFKFDFLSFLIILLPVYVFARVVVQYPDTASKYGLGAVIIMAICAYFASCRSRLSGHEMIFSVVMALAAFSVGLVALNVLSYATGYGFLNRNPRFYGSSTHPNFLGVQMAVCLMSLFALWSIGGRSPRIVAAVCMLACLFLIVLTGSRTAIIVVLFGAYGAFWQNFSPRLKAVAAVFAIVAVVGALSSESILSLDAYNRGSDGNTRSEAWSYLYDRVSEKPLLGFGIMEGYSENSILRGWATFGIMFPILLMTVTLLAAYQYAGTSRLPIASRPYAGIPKGILWGLLAGSVFEGYLADAFSFSWIVFVVAMILSSDVPRTMTESAGRTLIGALGRPAAGRPPAGRMPPMGVRRPGVRQFTR